MQSAISQSDVKNLISNCLTFNEQEFKIAVLGYRLFMLSSVGQDVSDLDKALRNVDQTKDEDVFEQFLSLTDNPFADSVVPSSDKDFIDLGYKVMGYRLVSEFRQLDGLVNGVKLSNLTKFVTDITKSVGSLFTCCNGMNAFKELLNAQLDNCYKLVDDLFDSSRPMLNNIRMIG